MKYLGGKARIGKHIAAFLQNYLTHDEAGAADAGAAEAGEAGAEAGAEAAALNGYLEPFCGSLSVLKHMTAFGLPVIACDYHADLIAMWQAVQEGSFEYPSQITEADYDAAKTLASPSALKAFIGFGLSFSGRYFGKYAPNYLGKSPDRDFRQEMVNSLKKTAPLITDVNFLTEDYRQLRPVGYLIYCDPPYAASAASAATSIYRQSTEKTYDTFDNEEFWEIMRRWSKDNLVFISETHAPADFEEVWRETVERTAARKEGNCKVVIEKIFRYSKYKI